MILALSIHGKPVLDSPDPSVFKSQNQYYLSYTVDSGHIPIFTSKNLQKRDFSEDAFQAARATPFILNPDFDVFSQFSRLTDVPTRDFVYPKGSGGSDGLEDF